MSITLEYERTIRACMAGAVQDGLLDPNYVRPLLAQHPEIPSKVIGQVYRRLRSEGTLVEHDLVRSNDIRGRNSGRMIFRYRVAKPHRLDATAVAAPVIPDRVSPRRQMTQGPCASCGVLHERYGALGQPLCEWCRP